MLGKFALCSIEVDFLISFIIIIKKKNLFKKNLRSELDFFLQLLINYLLR